MAILNFILHTTKFTYDTNESYRDCRHDNQFFMAPLRQRKEPGIVQGQSQGRGGAGAPPLNIGHCPNFWG